jgi:hypothetical protein
VAVAEGLGDGGPLGCAAATSAAAEGSGVWHRMMCVGAG